MKQVKFFEGKHPFELEEEINDFIKNKNIISISYSTSDAGYFVWHHCCIVYSV